MSVQRSIAIIGAGPAGLFAAERLAAAGLAVTVYDRMASPARKFLFAGRGGLNLTHSEPLSQLLARYHSGGPALAAAITAFPPEALRQWAEGLGEATFTGTSGRIFPKSFKATPLLRAWLRRLEAAGVTFCMNHRWTGWTTAGALTFEAPGGKVQVKTPATLLALGGASWPRLGSDGGWQAILRAAGVPLTPLSPSNAGVAIHWSDALRLRHEGAPLKGVAFSIAGVTTRAEAVITRNGLEGGAIYALSAPLRAALANSAAVLTLDLRPDTSEPALAARLAAAKKGDSLANILRKQAGLAPAAIGLLREAGDMPREPAALAARIKALPLNIAALQGFERAISSAGGIPFDALDARLMLKDRPGVFVAGEMLDWDAPTGGYLLQACFSTAYAASEGIRTYGSETPIIV